MLEKNIRELRVENGLTQAGLAEKIGVTQGAIYFWEKGINEPTAGYLIKLAETFGVSVDELLSHEKPPKEGGTKFAEMAKLFSHLTDGQKDALISTAKEFLKNK